MKKIIYNILIIASFGILFAEGGSLYSRYGIGLSKNNFSGRELGMGSSGFALLNNSYLNLDNPAHLANLKTTRFYTGYSLEGKLIEDNKFNRNYFNSSIDGFAFGFPISNDLGIGAVIGLQPLTKVNYHVQNELEGNDFTTNYKGQGGLSNLLLAFSLSPIEDFNLGFQLNYYFGNIDYRSEINYELTSDFKSTYFNQSRNYNGLGFKTSFITPNLSKTLGLDDIFAQLRMSLIYSFEAKINTDTTLSYSAVDGEPFEKSSVIKTILPHKIQAGLAVTLKNSTSFFVDYTIQPMENLQLGNQLYSNMDTKTKIAVGFETNREQSFNTTFWEEMNYRGGLTYERIGLKIKDFELTKIGLNAGFSIPLGFVSSLDVGLEVGKMGTKDKNLFNETYFNASFGINIGELWFITNER